MKRIAFIKLGLSLVVTEGWLAGCGGDHGGTAASGGAASAMPPAAGAESSATGGLASAAGVGAMGVSGSPSAGRGPGADECTTDANLLQTSMESHDHLPLTSPITAAQLNAGAPTEYALPLEFDHIHTLAFTPDDFAALRAGMIITKRSSSMLGHTHTYSIKCV